MSDGAAAVVIASEDALKAHKLTPLARIVAYHVSGCDPSIMGIGECNINQYILIYLVGRKINNCIMICKYNRACTCHH